MLRVVGLALVFVVGAATPAEAGGDRVSGGAGVARHGSPLVHEGRPSGEEQALAGRGAAVLAMARSLQPRVVDPQVDGTSGRRGLRSERRERQGLALPWRSQGRSILALPLTERLAVGLGYRHVRGEDLWREFTDIGSMEYDSHNVLLRAHWRF